VKPLRFSIETNANKYVKTESEYFHKQYAHNF